MVNPPSSPFGMIAFVVAVGMIATRSTSCGELITGLRPGPATTVIDGLFEAPDFPEYSLAIEQKLGLGMPSAENFWCGFCETFCASTFSNGYLDELKSRPGFENAGLLPFQAVMDGPAEGPLPDDEIRAAIGGPWNADELPVVAKWLEANRAALDRTREVAGRPRGFMPIIREGGPVVSSQFPYLRHSRDIAKALVARANLAIGNQDREAGWRDLLAVHQLSQRVEHGFTLFATVVGHAITSIALDSTVYQLAEMPGDAEAIAARWRSLSPLLTDTSALRQAHDSERLAMIQVALVCRADQFALESILLEEDYFAFDQHPGLMQYLNGEVLYRYLRWKLWCLSDVNDQLRLINEYMDHVSTALNEPDFQNRQSALLQVDDLYLDTPRPPNGGGFVDWLDYFRECSLVIVPLTCSSPMAPVDRSLTAASQKKRLVLGAMLAEMHFRRTGRDVVNGGSLEALRSEYRLESSLPGPLELFSDEPLKVRREKDHLLIYSVGCNGRDDDGEPISLGDGTDDIAVRLPRNSR